MNLDDAMLNQGHAVGFHMRSSIGLTHTHNQHVKVIVI